MKKIYIFLFLILFTATQIKAQTWTTYTIANGLPNNCVYAVAEDLTGTKWIGTAGGVAKYNGITWTSYTTAQGLASNHVEAIGIDSLNNKWFCTDAGVSKFNGTTWTTYNTSNGLINNTVRSMAIDLNGNKWFGTNGGVSKFDGTTWTNYSIANGLSDNHVLDIAVDQQNNLWFATGYGVSKYDGFLFTNFYLSDGLIDTVNKVVSVDQLGRIWFGGSTIGTGYYDGAIWTTVNDIAGIAMEIAFDDSSNIWCASYSGVFHYDGLIWNNYTSSNGLADDFVLSAAIDQLGDKWFGTIQGVTKYSDGGAGPINQNDWLQGVVFEDLNSNGIKDTNEQGLTGQIIQKNGYYAVSDNDGNFNFCLSNGLNTFEYIPQGYWVATTDTLVTINYLIPSDADTVIYFGILPIQNIDDVMISQTSTIPRAGTVTQHWLDYKNLGSVTQNGSITMIFDTLVSFINSTPAPLNITNNVLLWNYDTLASQEQRQIHILFQMPDITHLGDTLTCIASVTCANSDINLLNNTDTLCQILVGPYDPNYKIVLPAGVKAQHYTLFNSDLTYTIHFQNCGLDTAFNVSIRDTIDTDLELSTMQIVSSSYPVNLEIYGANILTFKFKDICLPDSTTNLLGSQGFIKYSIKPKNGLPENTVVENKANIYFDYNLPILTNTVFNTLVSSIPVSVFQYGISQDEIHIFPNPAHDKLTITTTAQQKQTLISIINMQGQIIKQILIPQSPIEVDVSALTKGIYIVKLQTETGITTKKLIIQ